MSNPQSQKARLADMILDLHFERQDLKQRVSELMSENKAYASNAERLKRHISQLEGASSE